MKKKDGSVVVTCPLGQHCATCAFCAEKRVGKGEQFEEVIPYCTNPEAETV